MSASTPHPGSMDVSALRRVTTVLCFTEITSWGILYYAYPVLAPTISAQTGWSIPTLMAAFTLSQVVAAVLSVPVGRRIDHRGPAGVMTLGSMAASASVVGIAIAPTLPWFFTAWTGAGVAMSMILYPPAFAALSHWGGDHRVTALTWLTLVGGLASTVFAPLTAVLVSHLGWRDTYLVLAIVLATTIPAHLWGLRGPWQPRLGSTDTTAHRSSTVWRTRPFIVLAVTMSAVAFCIYAVVINLVPLLIGRGFSAETAAAALGVGGIGQVSGRLAYRPLSRFLTTRASTSVIFGAVAATTLALALVPGPVAVVFCLSFFFGMARGIYTLVQATAIADRWGTARFGSLNGMLTSPVLAASALAPWAGALLAQTLGSQTAAFVSLGLLAAFAATLVPATLPRATHGPVDPPR